MRLCSPRTSPGISFTRGVVPLVLIAATLGLSGLTDRTSAATFECVDPSGRKVFTDSPAQLEKCTPLALGGKAGPSASFTPSPPPVTPETFTPSPSFSTPAMPVPAQPEPPQDYAAPMPPELQPVQSPGADPSATPPPNMPVIPPAPDYETAMKNLKPPDPGDAPPPPPPPPAQDGNGPPVAPLNPFNPLFPLFPQGSGTPTAK